MSVGGVGEGIAPSIKDLSRQAKAIQSRFKQIKSGAESDEILKVGEEAREVLSQLATLQKVHPEDKKIEKKIGAIRKLFEPIFESNVKILDARETGIRTSLLAQKELYKDQSDPASLYFLSGGPTAKLDELTSQVERLLESPPPPTKDDSRVALLRKIAEDRKTLALFTKDIEERRFKAFQERERRKEAASQGSAEPYKARLGMEAFRVGRGEAVVAQIKAEDTQLTTRDIKEGPLEKSEQTRHCEEIVRALLVDPNKVIVTEKEIEGRKKYFIKLPNEEGDGVELSALLANANFSQIKLSDNDLEAYARSSLLFKPQVDDARLIAQITGPRKLPLSQAEKEAFLRLTPAQRSIINNYTKEGVYLAVNTLFHTRDGNAVLEAMDSYLRETESRLEGFRVEYTLQYKDLDERLTVLEKDKSQYAQERAEWTEKSDALIKERQSLLSQKELLTTKRQELDAKIAQLGDEQASHNPEIVAKQEQLANEEGGLTKQEAVLAEQEGKLHDQGENLDMVAKRLETQEKEMSQELEDLNAKSADLKREEDSFKERKEKFNADKTALIKEVFLHAAAFNTALDSLPDADYSLDAQGKQQYFYRIVRSLPPDVLADLKRMGDEKLVMWAYGFTSVSQGLPSEAFLAQNPSAVIVLKATVGKNIAPLSDFDQQENEVLMAPMQVQVMGSTVDKESGTLMVYEVPVGGIGVGPTRLKTPQDIS